MQIRAAGRGASGAAVPAKGKIPGMRPPILRDFPEAFETERLLIRSPGTARRFMQLWASLSKS